LLPELFPGGWSGGLLERVSKMPFRPDGAFPQGLKPVFLLGHGGTAEAVPFPKASVPKPFRGVQNGAEPRHHTCSSSADCEAVPFPKRIFETRSSIASRKYATQVWAVETNELCMAESNTEVLRFAQDDSWGS